MSILGDIILIKISKNYDSSEILAAQSRRLLA